MKDSKKGFTILEAVIAMTVTLVLLSMILSLIVSVIKNTEKNRHENDVFSDLNIAETQIRNWFASHLIYNGDEYTYEFLPVKKINVNGEDGYFPVNSGESGEILAVCVKDARKDDGSLLEPTTLDFDPETKLMSCSDKYPQFHLKNIDRIVFEKNKSVIKASIFYDGLRIPQILLFNERLKYVS